MLKGQFGQKRQVAQATPPGWPEYCPQNRDGDLLSMVIKRGDVYCFTTKYVVDQGLCLGILGTVPYRLRRNVGSQYLISILTLYFSEHHGVKRW